MMMDYGITDFTKYPGGLYEFCDRGQVLAIIFSKTFFKNVLRCYIHL